MKLRLYIFFACLYVGIASREPPWADAKVMYEAAKSIVDSGSLEVKLQAPDFFFVIHDGKKYAINPPANIIAHIPSYLLYKALILVPDAPRDRLYRFTSHLSVALLMAGLMPLFFALARREGASARAALALTLLLGMGTSCVIYARVPFSEALQAVLLLWVVERALALGERLTARGALWAGVAAGLLLNTKVVNLFPIAVAAAYIVWRRRGEGWRPLARAAGAAAAALVPLVALLLAYNAARTGNPLDFGYRDAQAGEPIMGGDFYDAIYGLLFSIGRSIFLYSPPILLGVAAWPSLARRDPSRGLLILGIFVVLFFPHAKFHDWSGGNGWGSRYFVPLVPVMMLPAAGWLDGAMARGRASARRAALAALAAFSVLIQALGCAFWWGNWVRMVGLAAGKLSLTVILYIPQFSQPVGHAWMAWNKLIGDPLVMPAAPWARIAATPKEVAEIYAGTRFDWWVLDWMEASPSRWWAGVMLVGILAGLVWSGVGMWRRRRD